MPAASCGKPGHVSAHCFLLNRAAFVGERGWKVNLGGGRKVADRWSEDVSRRGYSVGEGLTSGAGGVGEEGGLRVSFVDQKELGRKAADERQVCGPCR